MSKERANHIACNTIITGYGSKDLVKLREIAWNCLPFSCFEGGINTKFFEDINEAISILKKENK